TRAPFELDAVDLAPDGLPGYGDRPALLIRLGGLGGLLPERMAALSAYLDAADAQTATDDQAIWQSMASFDWLGEGVALVKTPLTIGQIGGFDRQMREAGASRRYSVSGNVAWLGWPGRVTELHDLLIGLNLSGLVIWGEAGATPRIGVDPGRGFAQRLKQTLDPEALFPGL
ncbi:MAG: hypothetical protein HC802_23680, partial [Caldilineaceae bacterium]|nr:hypothetical protein [Caldilineaceae bacterium]